MAYEHLFQPIQIGTIEVKNRVVMAPMCTHYAAPDGSVPEHLIAYFEERAKGGAGLILPGFTFIDDKLSRASHNQIGVHSDLMVPGLNRLVERVQAHGARIFLQLCHGGRQSKPDLIGGRPIAPSAVSEEGLPPREMTPEEIREVVDAFGRAAERAMWAGFDGVELHGAHGYLIAEFLSDYTNRRTDGYGGDVYGRMRFALEVLAKVREYVGPEYPVGLRISGDEYLRTKGPGFEGKGITIEHAGEIAKGMADAGVAYVHVSACLGLTAEYAAPPMYLSRGYNVHLAAAVKENVDVPVITVGGINSPDLADQIVSEGKADLVAFGRALIADPYLPRKAEEGRPEEIRACIRCNDCLATTAKKRGVRCTVNPYVGEERDQEIPKAERTKRVLVIGGGPGGMEAALTARARGHEVVLCEASDRLGGRLVPGSVPEFKADLRDLLSYYETLLSKVGVQVNLNMPVSVESARAMAPDAVVMAVGGVEIRPHFPGADREDVYSAIEVLMGPEIISGDRVVVTGGGSVGCETALLLAGRGKRVTIVEMLDEILHQETGGPKLILTRLLREAGVDVLTGTKVDAITDEGVQAMDAAWNVRKIPADAVVLALGLRAEEGVIERFEEAFQKVYAVGDCVAPRRIYDAIHEGARAGRRT